VTESLRARQKALAARAILDALSELVVETGTLEVPIALVAERAGVSHRTVYNHFGDRDGLIEALHAHASAALQRLGATDVPESLSDLPGVIAANYRAMEAMADLTAAFARIDHARNPIGDHEARTGWFADRLRRGYPDLSERDVHALAAAVRQFAGTAPWYRLTREHGLSVDDAAATAAWAITSFIAALDAGSRPFPEDGR
jgi:AcrR family transcriptional regulator